MKQRLLTGNEAEEQEALFQWASYRVGVMPELQYLYHIPNGGKRDKRTAVSLYRQGVKAGVPDIHLPVAKNNYHGLYIELKVKKNKTTDHQNRWIDFLTQQGYLAVVCYGWQQAAEVIANYLNFDLSRPIEII